MKEALIRVRIHNGLATIDVRGELDRTSVDRLQAALGMAGRLAARTVVIDTTRLDFIDLTASRVLTASDAVGSVGAVLAKGSAVSRLEELLNAHPAVHDHAA